MNRRWMAVIAGALLLGSPALFSAFFPDAPEEPIGEMLEKIHTKMLSMPELKDWQASVRNTLWEMDKNWQPKKKTVIEKIALVRNKLRTEKILSAVEYDDGKTRDKTAKYQVQVAKFNRKNREEAQKGKKPKNSRHRGLDLDRDELFPFGESSRANYEFDLKQGSLEGFPLVYILETRSRQKSPDYFEGKYYIHPETLQILRAELKPAKNPGPLKRLDMDIRFDSLPQGHLVIRKARVRIHVGLIIKNIRMESEEIYSDYILLETTT